jgi:DNA-directed RNA polymerase subunit RPC12/RpoP
METLSVRCNHCGAPLEVGGETRFVTCQFCHSQLEVKRTDSTVFTEEIRQIAQTTQRMTGQLEVIELQNDIERLDREWMAANPVSFDKHGRPISQPGPVGSIFGLVFAVIFAIVCFSMAGSMGAVGGGGFISIVPVGMGIFAIAAGILGMVKSGNHQTAREAYQRRRAELVAKLEALR